MIVRAYLENSWSLHKLDIDFRGALQQRCLKCEFAIARSILNFISVIFALVYFRHSTASQATVIALLASAWAAGMQYWNKTYLSWLSSAEWFGTSSEIRAPLIQSYIKKLITSAAYAAMVYIGMIVSAQLRWQGIILATSRITMTVAESLFTQTAWQRNNQDWKLAAMQRHPHDEILFENLSGLGTLVQSAIAVMANVLNTSGNTLGLIITISVGTSGLIVAIRNRQKPKQTIKVRSN